jgi:hypothetical protein
MLHRSATGDSLDEAQEPERCQPADVVAEHAEGNIELGRQLAGTGRAAVERGQHPRPKRMRERLRDAGVSDVLKRLHDDATGQAVPTGAR